MTQMSFGKWMVKLLYKHNTVVWLCITEYNSVEIIERLTNATNLLALQRIMLWKKPIPKCYILAHIPYDPTYKTFLKWQMEYSLLAAKNVGWESEEENCGSSNEKGPEGPLRWKFSVSWLYQGKYPDDIVLVML